MEVVTLPVLALVAGFVSFSSPCCLPLVPGYLSYVSALPVSELEQRHAGRVTVRASLLFVAGFTVVFTIFGVTATVLGSLFLRNQDGIVKAFGVVMIALGLATMGVLLVGVGVLFVTGRWMELFRPLQRWFAELGWPPI